MSDESKRRMAAIMSMAAMMTASYYDPNFDWSSKGPKPTNCPHCLGKLNKSGRFVKGQSITIYRCSKCGEEA